MIHILNTKNGKRLFGALLSITASAPLVSSADRVALVIGISRYENTSKLPNATNDSTAVSKLLKSAGFEIVVTDSGDKNGISDVGVEGFYLALQRFSNSTVSAKVGLVYTLGMVWRKTSSSVAVRSHPEAV